MATEVTRERLQPGDGTEDSTQRGCTPWLLISCIVLTSTTAFIFGWGLGAPNMYNSYTEPFLKHQNPCLVEAEGRALENQTRPTAVVPNPNNEVAPVVNGDSAGIPADGEDIYEGTEDGDGDESGAPEENALQARKPSEEFNFLAELKKGIPQTVFLIGAFLGALTGPFWAKAFDRKRTVFANYVFCFASSLAVLLSYYKGYRFLFYVSRFVLGYQGKRETSLQSIDEFFLSRRYGVRRGTTVHQWNRLSTRSWCSRCCFPTGVDRWYPGGASCRSAVHRWNMRRLGLGFEHCLLTPFGGLIASVPPSELPTSNVDQIQRWRPGDDRSEKITRHSQRSGRFGNDSPRSSRSNGRQERISVDSSSKTRHLPLVPGSDEEHASSSFRFSQVLATVGQCWRLSFCNYRKHYPVSMPCSSIPRKCSRKPASQKNGFLTPILAQAWLMSSPRLSLSPWSRNSVAGRWSSIRWVWWWWSSLSSQHWSKWMKNEMIQRSAWSPWCSSWSSSFVSQLVWVRFLFSTAGKSADRKHETVSNHWV